MQVDKWEVILIKKNNWLSLWTKEENWAELSLYVLGMEAFFSGILDYGKGSQAFWWQEILTGSKTFSRSKGLHKE